MAGIADFISMAATNLGQSEESTKTATGALLGAMKEKADPGDFQKLLGALPGASDLMGAAVGAGKPSGGGGIGGMLGGALGGGGGALGALTAAVGGGGGALGLVGALAGSGFSMDKLGGLASLFMTFAKGQADGGLVSKLMGQVPELAKLIK